LVSVPRNCKEIHLANNKIESTGIALLKPLIERQHFRLKILNLENNLLLDKGSKIVMDIMGKCPTLKKLNLSKNQMTDRSAKSIYNLIMQTKSLEILYLHWNLLKGVFGASIAKAMQKNNILKVLDISYNNIGNQPETECIANW
jgi:Ran GTPase-activating protein (RanGAP) involved in mRNA processing and transport